MVDAKQLFTQAQSQGWALGAFNAANIETIRAIVNAALKLRSPVIIEASFREINYIGRSNFIDLIKNARQETGLPIFANLDHSPTVDEAMLGVKQNFDLIHYNGSALPLEQNITTTTKVVTAAHAAGILVEAEINKIQGASALHSQEDSNSVQKVGSYTDPNISVDFVSRTGIDTLAVAIGNLHGIYKTPPQLDLERLSQIAAKTDCFLSLHGGSGIPSDQVKAAIQLGIVKVNVNSELRLAYKNTLKEAISQTDEVAIYQFMAPVIAAVQEVVEEKILLLGSAGRASGKHHTAHD